MTGPWRSTRSFYSMMSATPGGSLNFFKGKLSDDFHGFPNAYYYDSGDIAEYTVHCGPNIWVGIGVLQYTHKTKDDYYLPVARAIADWLVTVQDKDPEGGLKGGPEFFLVLHRA